DVERRLLLVVGDLEYEVIQCDRLPARGFEHGRDVGRVARGSAERQHAAPLRVGCERHGGGSRTERSKNPAPRNHRSIEVRHVILRPRLLSYPVSDPAIRQRYRTLYPTPHSVRIDAVSCSPGARAFLVSLIRSVVSQQISSLGGVALDCAPQALFREIRAV